MHSPSLWSAAGGHTYLVALAVLCIVLAACAGPAAAQTQITDVEVRRHPVTGEQEVEIRMAEVSRDEIGDLIARLASDGESVSQVEVIRVHAPEGDQVTRTEERVHIKLDSGREVITRSEVRTRGGPAPIPDGANVAKAARQALARILARPAEQAPTLTQADLARVELHLEREPTAVAEQAGYRESWFDGAL